MYLPYLRRSLWPNFLAKVNKIVDPKIVATVTVETIKM